MPEGLLPGVKGGLLADASELDGNGSLADPTVDVADGLMTATANVLGEGAGNAVSDPRSVIAFRRLSQFVQVRPHCDVGP